MDVSSSPTIQYQVLVVAAGLTFLAGFLINVFIVAVTICEWKKGRPVSKTDQVITSLGITRMLFQGVCLMYVIIYTYFPGQSILVFTVVAVLEYSFVYSNIWLSALLSIIFWLKISTLHNVFFLGLRCLVLNKVFLLTLVSMFVPLSYILTYSLIFSFSKSYNLTQETYDNVFFGLRVLIMIFFRIGPLLIFLMSSVLLIIYLLHHIRRMKSERNGTSHLDTYYKTIKFTGFSLFCSTVFIIIEKTYTYCINVFGYLGIYLIWQIFPTLHSMYLIYATVKLRSQVSNVIRLISGKCHVRRAPVETVSQ
ncbi:taste receptor type 2 member 116-like [Leptodactylus fuscus]|uniref:taste receptor type 2 member 116-like n=1 Tax=Leptodactylus fuscus TaxID=238119 RepID=UPI003F4E86C4